MTCETGFLLHILIFLDLCLKPHFSANTLELVGDRKRVVWQEGGGGGG